MSKSITLGEIRVGLEYSFQVTMTQGGNPVDYSKVRITSIMDNITANAITNTELLLSTLKTTANASLLSTIDPSTATYYLVADSSSGTTDTHIVPDYVIVPDSLELLEPEQLTIDVVLKDNSEKLALLGFLNSTGITYTLTEK